MVNLTEARNEALSKASIAESTAEQFYEIAFRQASIMQDARNQKLAADAEMTWLIASLSLKRIKYAIYLKDMVLLDWAIGCMEHFNSVPQILGFRDREFK